MKVKQNWALGFLVLVTFVYILIYFLDISKSNTEVKEIYFAERITEAHQAIIKKFNKEYEGRIKVVPIDFPNFDFSTNERKELLARSLRGRGDGIDLFAVDIIWVKRFAKWCEKLDNYFSKEEISRLVDAALVSCYNDKDLVAVPLDIVQGIVYYREDLIDKMDNAKEIKESLKGDVTWEYLFDLKKHCKLKNPFYIYPAADYEGLICVFVEQLLSIDPTYFEKFGFNFNTPTAAKTLQLLVDLVEKYHLTPKVVTNFTEVPSYEYFIKNDGIFIRGWPTYDKDFKNSPFDVEKEKHLQRMTVPHFKGCRPSSLYGGWNLMVSKFSDKKEEAVEFIKFLLREDSQELFFNKSGYFPVIKEFYNNPIYEKKYKDLKEYRKLMDISVYRPAHSEYTKYSEIMSHFFEKAIRGEISVNEALTKATSAIESDKVL